MPVCRTLSSAFYIKMNACRFVMASISEVLTHIVMVLDYKDTSPFTNVQCQHTSTFIVMNAATHILLYALIF